MPQADLTLKLFVVGVIFIFLFLCADLFLVFYGNQVFGWEESPFDTAIGYLNPIKQEFWPYEETPAQDYASTPYYDSTPYYVQSGQSGFDDDSTYFNDATQSLDPQKCLQISDVNRRDSCLFTVAKVSINSQTCAMIASVFDRDSCYLSLSYDLKTVDVCKKMEGEYEADACILRIAETTMDENLCYQAGAYLSFCFQEMAMKKGKEELCDSITEGGYKNQCLEFFRSKGRAILPECETPKQALDDSLGIRAEIEIDKCYAKKALEAGDITVCERARLPSTCISDYAYTLSKAGSGGECPKLSLAEYRDDCYFYSSNCLPISEISRREMCIVNNASGFTDTNQCDMLTIAGERGRCYGFVANNKGDDSACALLESGPSENSTEASGRDTCYSIFVLGNEERLPACQKIESENEKSTCIWRVAVMAGKTKYCEMLPAKGEGITAESCYSSLADSLKNPALCEKVSDAQEKNYCLAMSTGDSSYCEKLEEYRIESCKFNLQN